MRAELRKILGMAMAQLGEHIRSLGGLAKRGLKNIDEATFRSMVLRALMTRLPDADCQTEWCRYDLLVQVKGLNVLIEFKFYVSRLSRSLGGEHVHWKGGACPKNEGEFRACVEKLRDVALDERDRKYGIDRKYLVLVYERAAVDGRCHSFAQSYDDLKAGEGIRSVDRIKHALQADVTCTLLEIA